MTKAASLKEVAKLAGVGLGTCSRVLNNHPSVSEAKRRKVLAAMKELEYRPNAIARSLKMKTTKTIGVLIPDISSPYFPEIVRGLEDVASVYQYNIILCDSDLDREKELSSFSVLKQKKVDGIIFISNSINESLKEAIIKLDIPIVIIATSCEGNVLPSVTIDNVKAAYEAVDYLCSLGHRDIYQISGRPDDPNAGAPRIEGYKRALEKHNIKFDASKIYVGDYTYRTGYECMKKILDDGHMPTAVFAASDSMAIGAAKAIAERDLKIPEDISIVGFDGIESAVFYNPPITTVEQPRYDMGAVGMRLLTKIINKEEIENKNIVLKYNFVIRDSCKKHF